MVPEELFQRFSKHVAAARQEALLMVFKIKYPFIRLFQNFSEKPSIDK